MAKDFVYASKLPNAQGLYSYTPDDDAVWGELFTRQVQALEGRMAPAYFDGVQALGLTPNRVPQVRDLDQRLAELSRAGVEGVPAIIPPTRFFTLLSERRFPVATFLRRREDMDYIEEPDLFHEVFGHCPMMTDPRFVSFIEAFGQAALRVPKSMRWHMFRLFWFTVEFGLVDTPDGVRAYGAGIASSPSEAENVFDGDAEIKRFDLSEVLRTPYRIDIVQPIYFVIASFDALPQLLIGNIEAEIAAAMAAGDLPPVFDPA